MCLTAQLYFRCHGSDIIFALICPKGNITCEVNITGSADRSRRKANITKKTTCFRKSFFLVGEGGFEPPKSLTTDLQSAPFGHSGILPYSIFRRKKNGAGGRIRTPDLLITNQLLYLLSYTSLSLSFCAVFLSAHL